MITVKGEIEGISTRKDRTIKIAFSTQELKGKDAAKLLDLQNKMVTLGIAPNEITPDEIQLLQEAKLSIEDVPNGKSRSLRMRHALYRYWQQHDTGYEKSEAYYEHYMDTLTNKIISKLES
jgi:hypothetical protein